METEPFLTTAGGVSLRSSEQALKRLHFKRSTGPGFAINWLWDYGQVILFIWVLGVLIYKMKSLDWMIKGLDSDFLMLINSLSQSIHYEWALWFTFLHCKYLKQGIFIYS